MGGLQDRFLQVGQGGRNSGLGPAFLGHDRLVGREWRSAFREASLGKTRHPCLQRWECQAGTQGKPAVGYSGGREVASGRLPERKKSIRGSVRGGVCKGGAEIRAAGIYAEHRPTFLLGPRASLPSSKTFK